MSNTKIKVGQAVLSGFSDIRQQKKVLSLEDIGDVFMQISSNVMPQHAESDRFVHDEIVRLSQHIKESKKEIFALSADETSEANFVDASRHLDAVIETTEEASNSIMDAADIIRKETADMDGEKAQSITNAINRIYEACSFQDITGQRIAKVIKLLDTIEERIGKINGLLGIEAVNGTVNPPADVAGITVPADEKELLNGPQLPGNASSQADIDALFASLGDKN